MKVPATSRHIPRGSTAASMRRAQSRLAQSIDNSTGDLVNPTSGTPIGAHACRVYNPTPTSFVDSATTAITWGTESFDIDNWHDNSTNPGRITVSIAGIYLVEAKLDINYSPGGTARLSLVKNGSLLAVVGQSVVAAGVETILALTTVKRAVNDYLSVSFWQATAGATQSVNGSGEYDCFFSVALLGTN